ncbi:hypothetical protein F8B43_1805 [Methylorubrum populi]|jgi:hypothetical protein|uniref:Uncharacterized protein n=1 Tax=Methylorubrum populi TaxID=223967 RepID=A0A833J8P4_9HYPH|nr:hypothetical protein F8B43_1805 [Methylorubrum populi]
MLVRTSSFVRGRCCLTAAQAWPSKCAGDLGVWNSRLPAATTPCHRAWGPCGAGLVPGRRHGSGRAHDARLPRQKDAEAHAVSVLSPVGVALVGLSGAVDPLAHPVRRLPRPDRPSRAVLAVRRRDRRQRRPPPSAFLAGGRARLHRLVRPRRPSGFLCRETVCERRGTGRHVRERRRYGRVRRRAVVIVPASTSDVSVQVRKTRPRIPPTVRSLTAKLFAGEAKVLGLPSYPEHS